MKPSQVSTLVLSISLCSKLLLQASRVDDCHRALRSVRIMLCWAMHSARQQTEKRRRRIREKIQFTYFPLQLSLRCQLKYNQIDARCCFRTFVSVLCWFCSCERDPVYNIARQEWSRFLPQYYLLESVFMIIVKY